MKARKYLDVRLPHLRIPIWWPSSLPEWRSWLPTRGNVIFTLAMIALVVLAQSVGALPLGRPQAAPNVASTATIAYQGRLADADGRPLTGTYPMIFRLYDVATGGTPLWTEQWTGSNSVRVSDGLFNVMLGSLNAIRQQDIAGHDQLWLGITVGTDDEMQPRVQLGNVPFAVQALTVPDGSITAAKLAPDVTLGVSESTGVYTATIRVSEGTSPTVTPASISLQYYRVGAVVFVSMPVFELSISGLPNVLDFSLPFALATDDRGGGGVLTFNGGGPNDVVGVIVGNRMSFRKPSGGFSSGLFRGGFWFIAQ